MKIILKEDIDGLGDCGEVVEVRAGYARNYLIPRNLALAASKKNMKAIEAIKLERGIRENKRRKAAERLAEELESISCTASVSVGEEDKVFGAVTSQMIASLLKDKGYDIDRRKIILEEPIHALGVYTIPIRLESDVVAKLKLWVVKE